MAESLPHAESALMADSVAEAPAYRIAVTHLSRQRDEAIAKVERLNHAHRDVLSHARRAQTEIDAAQQEADELNAAIDALSGRDRGVTGR